MSPFRRGTPEPEHEEEPPRRPSVAGEREHARRALSWSPERYEDDVEPEPATAVEPAPPVARPAERAVVEPRPAPLVRLEPAVAPVPRPPLPVAPVADETSENAPKRRGRPRGKKPRRQVHFHVDQDEEKLLLAAARLHGSQQKGLIAALESLQETEFLRHEIERLEAECERQRRLLADAEALFRR